MRTGRDLYAAEITSTGPLHVDLEGFLHAAVAMPAGDRERPEHLCRYVLRSPIAQAALEMTPEGKVLLRLRRPWTDGTRAILFGIIAASFSRSSVRSLFLTVLGLTRLLSASYLGLEGVEGSSAHRPIGSIYVKLAPNAAIRFSH